MKTIKKSIIFALALCSAIYSNVLAVDYTGCAVYRDGVASAGIDINWHSGIVISHDLDSSNAIAHMRGRRSGDDSESVSKSFFITNNTDFNNKFMGVYKNSSMQMMDSVYIAATARELVSQNIQYVFLNRMDVFDIIAAKKEGVIKPTNVKSLRCDGLVEYCYSYNGLPIQINISDPYDLQYDSPVYYNPKTQAQSLTKISD